jgi:predicted dehydrogenase
MNKVRLGVIGTGAFAATCHVPGLQSHPQAQVIALCGRDYGRTRSMANRLGVSEVSTDYEELCARTDLDAITIASPNVFHAAQAQAALVAGKHVFCEKPLGMNVRQAANMLQVAVLSGMLHQVAFTYRYLYGIQELKRRLFKGDIGEPYYVRLHYESWDGVRPDAEVGFREKLDLAGGGILYDVGSHLLDLVRFVLGRIEGVTGCTIRIPRHRKDSRTGLSAAVETDDIASAYFVCRNGLHGQLFASRATPYSGEKAYMEVVGRDGALKASLSRGANDQLQFSRPTMPGWENVPLSQQASDGTAHCLPLMMQSFVNACLRGSLDTEIDASFHDGFAVQQLLTSIGHDSESSGHDYMEDAVTGPMSVKNQSLHTKLSTTGLLSKPTM